MKARLRCLLAVVLLLATAPGVAGALGGIALDEAPARVALPRVAAPPAERAPERVAPAVVDAPAGAPVPEDPAVEEPLPALPCRPAVPTPTTVDTAPVDETQECVRRLLVEMSGEDPFREDVRITLDMEFRDLQIDLLRVAFGGGKFEAQIRIDAHLEFRALSIGRIQEALSEASGGVVNLSELGVNSSRQYVTADEFRLLLGGEALAAFEGEQEERVAEMLAASFPELTVLTSRFEWSNTVPAAIVRGDTTQESLLALQEPPIVLDATVEFQYLDRKSLVDILESAWERYRERKERETPAAMQAEDPPADPRKALLQQLREENQGAFYERSAFSVLGITQLLVLRMEPGWDLAVNMELPPGYTFEYASPDVALDEMRRGATVQALARDSPVPVENPAAVSLSNRFLVTVALLVAVLGVGVILRVPAFLLANRIRTHSVPGERLVKRFRAVFK